MFPFYWNNIRFSHLLSVFFGIKINCAGLVFPDSISSFHVANIGRNSNFLENPVDTHPHVFLIGAQFF